VKGESTGDKKAKKRGSGKEGKGLRGCKISFKKCLDFTRGEFKAPLDPPLIHNSYTSCFISLKFI